MIAPLPADLEAAVCVVVHFPAHATSVLPQILKRAGVLHAAHAEDGEPLLAGRVYVARPAYHLLVEEEGLRLSREPRVNRNRPAIDPLFHSAALTFRERAIGVILSGNLDDGTAGLMALKAYGGTAIVQDPDDASHGEMPRSAIQSVQVDYVVPAVRIGSLLVEVVRSVVTVANRTPVTTAPASASQRAVHPPSPNDHFLLTGLSRRPENP